MTLSLLENPQPIYLEEYIKEVRQLREETYPIPPDVNPLNGKNRGPRPRIGINRMMQI